MYIKFCLLFIVIVYFLFFYFSPNIDTQEMLIHSLRRLGEVIFSYRFKMYIHFKMSVRSRVGGRINAEDSCS